nr:receptor like protein 29-like [Populus alba]
MRLIISFQYALEEHHAGLKVLSSRLKKLENLHLRWNQYNDSIFPSLTGFSSLKSLDLSYNQLTGSGFQLQPMRLGKLENLDLSGNQLNSSILSILSGLSSLKSLDLSHNKLTGSINSFQLQPVRLGKLENLDLSWNQCNDSIFPSLTGFSSLKSLDLSGNEMTGSGIIHSFYLNASHDILLIILFLYQQK